METPKQRAASKAKPDDMDPKRKGPEVTKEEKRPPSPNPALPRYDDQPKRSRGDKQSGGGDLPDYGDQEPGDPRQIEIRDTPPAE